MSSHRSVISYRGMRMCISNFQHSDSYVLCSLTVVYTFVICMYIYAQVPNSCKTFLFVTWLSETLALYDCSSSAQFENGTDVLPKSPSSCIIQVLMLYCWVQGCAMCIIPVIHIAFMSWVVFRVFGMWLISSSCPCSAHRSPCPI